MKQITIREFIETELCGSIKQTMENHPYFAFGAIANAIELLGNCMDSCDWNKTRLSKERFNNAIKTLPSLKKYQTADLYLNLRCGMAHMIAPTSSLRLADKEGEYNPQTKTLHIETFYADFNAACQYLISNPALWGNEKSPETIWWEVYEVEKGAPTGSTMDNKTEQSHSIEQ
mgnify:CR=1 FL=1